jgi:KUP system potassium uptake protein
MVCAEAAAPASRTAGHGHKTAGQWALTIGAIGVVFGDIGTSPLYAIKECFSPESHHPVAVTEANVFGVLSLVLWSLVSVIVVKYLTFIMRADNDGAGGIMSLLALIPSSAKKAGLGFQPPSAQGASIGPAPERPTSALRAAGGRLRFVVPLALFGTALLYGDGVITPAISVLSAVEGLGVATHALDVAIIPITLGILTALFWVQKRGTAGIGKVFGPVTILWFVTIAALGVRPILENPQIFGALDPRLGVTFLLHNGTTGFLLLGSVFLVVTGGEALYADMGHFGRGPIRRGWYLVVFPALLLNYFGQGANLLAHPETATNPFYGLVPQVVLYPVVAIATAATVVASQALISGAFSLTQQSMQLGYFPRVSVVHTSKDTEGQIYIPEINWGLWVGCVVCVLLFKSSTALAAAYGIAVTGTMAITTALFYVVARERWHWPVYKAGALVVGFLVFDLAFLAANAAKFFDGGWFPLAGGVALFAVMTTWKKGRELLGVSIGKTIQPLDAFLTDVKRDAPPRVRGSAVFMASSPTGTPPILKHHFTHNQALHEQIILLSVHVDRVPFRGLDDRVRVEDLGAGFRRVTLSFGFMQSPNVPAALRLASDRGLLDIDLDRTSYYIGRETLLTTGLAKMMRWRKALFAFTSRNARPATAYFGLPPARVVELGMQIDL